MIVHTCENNSKRDMIHFLRSLFSQVGGLTHPVDRSQTTLRDGTKSSEPSGHEPWVVSLSMVSAGLYHIYQSYRKKPS